MPADYGVGLNDRQRTANFREQPIETNEYQSVDGTEGEFFLEQPAAGCLLAAATSKSLPQALPATGADRQPSNQ
jgi:hypothetical protein